MPDLKFNHGLQPWLHYTAVRGEAARPSAETDVYAAEKPVVQVLD